MKNEQEREAFEAWHRQDLLDMPVHQDPKERQFRTWQARAALAANEKQPSRATDIATALALPGCERLKEWAEIGAVQRAAVEEFAYALAANVPADLRHAFEALAVQLSTLTLERDEAGRYVSAVQQMLWESFQLRRATAPAPAPEAEPHLAGPFKCFDCNHEWVAVRPAGADALECPACGSRNTGIEPLFTAEEVHAYCKRGREEERAELLSAPAQAQQAKGDPKLLAILNAPMTLQEAYGEGWCDRKQFKNFDEAWQQSTTRFKAEAKPEAQQPLQDDEVLDIARYWSNRHFVDGAARFLIDFARAIERAHGIGASGEK